MRPYQDGYNTSKPKMDLAEVSHTMYKTNQNNQGLSILGLLQFPYKTMLVGCSCALSICADTNKLNLESLYIAQAGQPKQKKYSYGS
jgi:hypothetical protein